MKMAGSQRAPLLASLSLVVFAQNGYVEELSKYPSPTNSTIECSIAATVCVLAKML